ncbi:hypothetical protein CK203_095827 [Vitis vinifera]|uniref:Reverse transcriptase Ty1/copia-type domain-containing protein n=1 Tax=Vitis vinifera TaxID=29760 RepID=A0A438CK52_VITVI|nr:hypothetical protein CK203_095827 [Vitis vinifera]
MEPIQVHEEVTQQPQEPQVQVPLRRSTRERRSTISDDYVVYLQEHEFDMGLEDDPISVSQVKQSSNSEKWIEAMKDEMKSMKDNGVWDLVELPEAHYDLELHQMDVKTAFLNGNIDETIYMVQPENFESNDSKQLENVDQCIYLKFSGSKFIILVLYVDDILLASSDIYRDRSRGILGLSQKAYIDKVLSRFGMSNCAPGDTPVAKGDKFSLHQCPKNELEKKDMERYLSNPGMDHLEKGKTGYAEQFHGKVLNKHLLLLHHGGRIHSCYEASNHGIWLRNFITQLRIIDGIEKPLRINCDNKAAELYSKNNRSSSKSKHIDIKFLVVKERVQSLQVSIEHISTNSMIADPLTKGLPPKVYHEHVTHMGVVHIDDVLV